MQHERAGVYRSAGTLLAGSSVVVLVADGLHPRFTSATYTDPVAYVGEIGGSSLWLVDHLVLLAAGIGTVVGAVGLLVHLAEEERPRAWAWATVVVGILAGTVAIATLVFDGIAATIFAETAGASSAEAAAVIAAIDVAAFASLGLIVFGVLPMMLGMTLVRSAVYPHWLGFVALAAGVVGIVMGVAATVAGEVTTLVTTLFLIASIGTTLVWLGGGLLLRRHASHELGAVPTATPA